MVRKIRSNVPSWEQITSSQVDELVSLVREPLSYAWKPGAEAPVWIPFRDKLVDILCLRSDTSSGFFFMANGRRLDYDHAKRLWVLDQEPFLLAVLPDNSLSLASGMYIHHGNWTGRTRPLPAHVASAFLGTPVASFYPLPDAPPHTYGPISELVHSPWEQAFKLGLKRLAGESS